MSANSQSNKIKDNLPLIHPECGSSNPAQAQPSSSMADEKSSNKTIKKDPKNFLFDMIVARLDIPGITAEQLNKILIYVNFNRKNFKISASRINVLDFSTESIFEFVADRLVLKQQLSVAPLTIKVADAKQVLGYGTLKWPKEFLSTLEMGTGETTGSFEIELMRCDGTRTGTMLIIVRLLQKCDEYEEDNTLDGKCLNANKEIHPNDVLFLVGDESKKDCCCSQIGIIPAADSDEELLPKCLDLSSYRAVNSQNVATTKMLASQDPCCQKAEEINTHYKKILDVLKSRNQDTPDKRCDWFRTLPSDSSLKVNVIPSHSNLIGGSFPADSSAFAAKDVQQIPHRESLPELIENKPQSLRYCPLCKENMEFLPKLAACPNCGYKPIPCFEEKPYDDSQNADQILEEFQENLQKNDNSVVDTCPKGSAKGRCTCKYGSKKPCAHCRIRKLCEGIFQSPLPTTNNCDVCEPKSSSVKCVSSSENRPFLTRIFSELKDLYDIEEPKKKELELDAGCEKRLNKFSAGVKQLSQETKSKRDLPTVQNQVPDETVKRKAVKKRKKNSAKAASRKAVKSKLYDYQLATEVFNYKCGHKTCVKRVPQYKNVPPTMGWLWTIHNPGKWKPGFIRKPIKELMRYFLKDFPADTLLVSPYSYRRTSKSNGDSSHKTILQKPTLHVHKKNGEYIITMRPLKPTEVLKDCADPYENMKPIQFRIIKNPQLEMTRSLKSCLKSMGFKKCVCHRPITDCYCRSFMDKKKLEYQCKKECNKRQIESCCDTLILTDTSESEDEFDFAITPPVGLVKPEKLKATNLVNVSTQYNELDWNPMPLFPRPPNKYMQMYQCAVTERKNNAILVGDDNYGTKDSYNTLGKGACARRPFGNSTGTAGKRPVIGARGEGDGLFIRKKTVKASSVPADYKRKYGGRCEENEENGRNKIDMMKYVKKADKKQAKVKPEVAALRRKEKRNLLKGVSPPLLCMVDRRGKPVNPCAPLFPCADDRVC